MKLTEKEISQAKFYMEQYRDVAKEIADIEQETKLLDLRRKHAVKNIGSVRERDAKFLEELTTKYGKGKLEPFQMVWIPINEEEE